MAQEYDNTNTGALFVNDRKQRDNHPDYRGTVNVNGQEFWVSAWVKTSKRDGSEFFSLSIQPKDAPREQAPARTTTTARTAPAQARSYPPPASPAPAEAEPEDEFGDDPLL